MILTKTPVVFRPEISGDRSEADNYKHETSNLKEMFLLYFWLFFPPSVQLAKQFSSLEGLSGVNDVSYALGVIAMRKNRIK